MFETEYGMLVATSATVRSCCSKYENFSEIGITITYKRYWNITNTIYLHLGLSVGFGWGWYVRDDSKLYDIDEETLAFIFSAHMGLEYKFANSPYSLIIGGRPIIHFFEDAIIGFGGISLKYEF